MIVVTSVNNNRRHLIEGDEFCLTVTQEGDGCDVEVVGAAIPRQPC